MKPDWKGWKAKAMTTWFAGGRGFYSGMRYRKGQITLINYETLCGNTIHWAGELKIQSNHIITFTAESLEEVCDKLGKYILDKLPAEYHFLQKSIANIFIHKKGQNNEN
jgi:hypothetical protein